MEAIWKGVDVIEAETPVEANGKIKHDVNSVTEQKKEVTPRTIDALKENNIEDKGVGRTGKGPLMFAHTGESMVARPKILLDALWRLEKGNK
jgi:hypothetical protein